MTKQKPITHITKLQKNSEKKCNIVIQKPILNEVLEAYECYLTSYRGLLEEITKFTISKTLERVREIMNKCGSWKALKEELKKLKKEAKG